MNKYNFLYDSEPTDEQLQMIMQEVAIDVKEKAKEAEAKFWANHKKIIYDTIEKENKLNNNSNEN
ncbi:MAG TPA: hypothetical protein PK762_02890 [Candidatus Kapabacteria bacterium]|nr:hypothetical protein [Candidatus Kapabacteria bacterium]